MKLHNILYFIGFACLMLGAGGIDGWLENGTSLIKPLVCIVVATIIMVLANKGEKNVSGI